MQRAHHMIAFVCKHGNVLTPEKCRVEKSNSPVTWNGVWHKWYMRFSQIPPLNFAHIFLFQLFFSLWKFFKKNFKNSFYTFGHFRLMQCISIAPFPIKSLKLRWNRLIFTIYFTFENPFGREYCHANWTMKKNLFSTKFHAKIQFVSIRIFDICY